MTPNKNKYPNNKKKNYNSNKWNPYTSKWKAALDKGMNIKLEGKENILLVYETVKGTMFNLEIESEEEPKPTDFAVTVQSMETPQYEEELVSKVFFKGTELERSFDEEFFRGKSLTVELFTMDDLDSDDDWDVDEEE